MHQQPDAPAENSGVPKYKVALMLLAAVALTYYLTPKITVVYHFHGDTEMSRTINAIRLARNTPVMPGTLL